MKPEGWQLGTLVGPNAVAILDIPPGGMVRVEFADGIYHDMPREPGLWQIDVESLCEKPPPSELFPIRFRFMDIGQSSFERHIGASIRPVFRAAWDSIRRGFPDAPFDHLSEAVTKIIIPHMTEQHPLFKTDREFRARSPTAAKNILRMLLAEIGREERLAAASEDHT